MPERFKNDDLLTLEQIADHFGYSLDYLYSLSSENSRASDPLFRRMRVKTDPTWRKAFKPHVQYVYPYGELKVWFYNHQTSPTVRTFNEGRGIIVDL